MCWKQSRVPPYYGFTHEISKEEFERRIQDNTLTDALNAVPVHKGDCFFIPSGTLHAIRKGIVVAEIQQNSNVTYRIYDYGRLGARWQAPAAAHPAGTGCYPPGAAESAGLPRPSGAV